MAKAIINTTPDQEGNFFEIINDGDTIIIFLKLKKEKKKREIGIIYVSQSTLFITRNREKHLFRKNQSYGFNEFIISHATKFEYVRFNDEFISALIPRKVILEKGSYLHFKENGFERQLFLSLEEINKYSTGKLF
jgi:uncharacterized pyridoxamine 5'-phosphate oxidase family protein